MTLHIWSILPPMQNKNTKKRIRVWMEGVLKSRWRGGWWTEGCGYWLLDWVLWVSALNGYYITYQSVSRLRSSPREPWRDENSIGSAGPSHEENVALEFLPFYFKKIEYSQYFVSYMLVSCLWVRSPSDATMRDPIESTFFLSGFHCFPSDSAKSNPVNFKTRTKPTKPDRIFGLLRSLLRVRF